MTSQVAAEGASRQEGRGGPTPRGAGTCEDRTPPRLPPDYVIQRPPIRHPTYQRLPRAAVSCYSARHAEGQSNNNRRGHEALAHPNDAGSAPRHKHTEGGAVHYGRLHDSAIPRADGSRRNACRYIRVRSRPKADSAPGPAPDGRWKSTSGPAGLGADRRIRGRRMGAGARASRGRWRGLRVFPTGSSRVQLLGILAYEY